MVSFVWVAERVQRRLAFRPQITVGQELARQLNDLRPQPESICIAAFGQSQLLEGGQVAMHRALRHA